MNIKSPDRIIESLIEKYLVQEENVLHMGRLFTACSVVRWIFENTNRTDEIIQYLNQVEKYLDGQIELYWQDSTIKVRRVKRGKQ